MVYRNHRTYCVVFIYVEERNKWYTSYCAEEDLSDYTGEVPAGAETFQKLASIRYDKRELTSNRMTYNVSFVEENSVYKDVINKDDPVYSIYQDDLTSFHVSRIVGMINASLTNVRLSSKSVQLCFNKQEFLDEVFGLLEDMYYDDGDDVDIHVYTVGNHT